ncbi:unnamed protein product [Merluccius merluccius]
MHSCPAGPTFYLQGYLEEQRDPVDLRLSVGSGRTLVPLRDPLQMVCRDPPALSLVLLATGPSRSGGKREGRTRRKDRCCYHGDVIEEDDAAWSQPRRIKRTGSAWRRCEAGTTRGAGHTLQRTSDPQT